MGANERRRISDGLGPDEGVTSWSPGGATMETGGESGRVGDEFRTGWETVEGKRAWDGPGMDGGGVECPDKWRIVGESSCSQEAVERGSVGSEAI
ncbi:unnamed protein product [Linum trigynum]|uniref:Uncharacterized protein n=1 Tax=Linum trigynum TaxID=586398 RepID=A0AAV2F195_9ROSI